MSQKELREALKLYLRTYAETQKHPTVSQEVACIQAAQKALENDELEESEDKWRQE